MAPGVFVGLSTIDLVHTVDTFPSPNSKINARSQEFFVGGPSTNAAIAFSHLGSNAALVSAVGQNPLAKIIKDELERYTIELIDLTPESSELPPISSVWVDSQGRRSVVSVNAVRYATLMPEVDSEILADTRILQVDGHSMAACQAWARMAHSREIPVVLDGGSWKAGTEDLLAFVDIAICSADFRPPACIDEEQVIRYLRAHNVENIVITHGGAPIRFVLGSAAGEIPVPATRVADSTGAGDILHGAFCFYAITGNDLEESLRKAAIVASDSCRYPGTRCWMQP